MVCNEVRNITHSVDGKSLSDVYHVTIYWIDAEDSTCAGKAQASMMKDSSCAGKARASMLPKHHNEASAFEAHLPTCDDGAASSCLLQETDFDGSTLSMLEDSINARLALASLILEDAKEDEAISLLSPPKDLDFINSNSNVQKPWWLDGKIKLKLCHIYKAKGMLQEFVNKILPLVHESLYVKTLRPKENDVFGEVRPLASKSDLMRASRARKLLQKKEEQKAAGIDLHSDYSVDKSLLCKALQSLQRYSEAPEIINLTQRLVSDKLHGDKEELLSLLAQISFNATDPKHGFDYFTMLSHHQDAAREYLDAYKLMPECPLINLCVGTALINLTLGFRFQNKHQCLAQGLAFLYNNLQLTENSQEALYNIARAYHHIMKREAAYNLHLIYKNSGAFDLARQVLKITALSD
ncbi:unnamed protein product [Dovyalis caffra]|uniref:Uncharacterized protein n=1 Tax=Dovyalis caffra TaxID=77055 RepID=A0AAV1RW58_9ROSI|nr:unnamed protein product [Dovyalis caffra]